MRMHYCVLAVGVLAAVCSVGCGVRQVGPSGDNNVTTTKEAGGLGPYCGTNAVLAQDKMKAYKDVLLVNTRLAIAACQVLSDAKSSEPERADARKSLQNIENDLRSLEASLQR